MTIIESLLNVIAPFDCLVCEREGSLLCSNCRESNCPPIPSRCYRCKKLTSDFAVCENCRRTSRLNNLWVRSEYSDVAKDLIYKMKFESARAAATVCAELMNEIMPYFSKDTLIVHIPTATFRRRQRGYDHAKLIAKRLGELKNIQVVEALERLGQTRQTGAGRTQRLEQMKTAFCVNGDVSGATILLADDVVTTGGTLEAAAAELKNAGAKKVYAVVLAQK